MPTETPVSEVLPLVKNGLSNEEISRRLEAKGYTLQQIGDAINQAKIKQGVEGNMPPQEAQGAALDDFEIPLPDQGAASAPGPQQSSYQQPSYQQQSYQMPSQQMGYEEMQALVEQIIEEKWKEMMHSVGDIPLFKARVGDDMESVKQELVRTQKRLEDLQVAVLGKVREYNENVLTIGNDMKALEQVFSRILEPLTTNVKELGRISEELKKK